MQKMRWEEYFEYSRKERVAIFMLLLTITVVFLAPLLISKKSRSPEQTAKLYQEMSKELLAMENENATKYKEEAVDPPTVVRSETNHVLFKFDPNTLAADGWKKLGVGDRTVRTIQKYLSKGGRFRKPEDISRIYGMKPDMADRLMPYVSIPNQNKEIGSKKFAQKNADKRYPSFEKTARISELLDINIADTAFLYPYLELELNSRCESSTSGKSSVDFIQ
jgi:DNA uptake protein ComE-like DNA-binding protein